jgi:hypothetical protein
MQLLHHARSLSVASILCLFACGTTTQPKTTQDAGLSDPNHDPCTQPGDQGNELHVGEYCTAGSTTCGNNINTNANAAFACTLDEDPTANLAMCTKPCSWNGDCGSNAVCTGDHSDTQGPFGCVPAACTCDPGIPFPPGTDAGSYDAGWMDGGW